MPAGRLSLRTKLLVFNVGMVVGTLAVLVGMDRAFQHLRINGPLYQAIAGGQAVVADILRPPARRSAGPRCSRASRRCSPASTSR